MTEVVKHVTKYFSSGSVIKHAYIEFFNLHGIRDFKQTFKSGFVAYPNVITEITKAVKNIKIAEPPVPKAQSNSRSKPKIDKSICGAIKKDGVVCGKKSKENTGKCGIHSR
jgi:hypothetical protein